MTTLIFIGLVLNLILSFIITAIDCNKKFLSFSIVSFIVLVAFIIFNKEMIFGYKVFISVVTNTLKIFIPLGIGYMPMYIYSRVYDRIKEAKRLRKQKKLRRVGQCRKFTAQS